MSEPSIAKKEGAMCIIHFAPSFFAVKPNLPANAVILPVIAGAAPHGAMLPVKINSVDRSGGACFKAQFVAFSNQLLAHPWRRIFLYDQPAGLWLSILTAQ